MTENSLTYAVTENSLTYTVRANALEPERTWRLQSDALHWNSKQGPQHFPLANITDIRLEFAPSRANRTQYLCHVGIKTGWTETIPSTHYAGIMQFEDRARDYNLFVMTVVQAVAAANPSCRIRGGATTFQYLGNAAIILVAVLALAFVLLVVGMPITVIAGVKLLIIMFYLPTLFRWFKRNGPSKLPAQGGVNLDALRGFLPPQP